MISRCIVLFLLAICRESRALSQFKPLSRISRWSRGDEVIAPAANHISSDDDIGAANQEDLSCVQLRISRRNFFSQSSCIVPASALFQSSVASAAPPLTPEETDNFSARAERALRPKPPKVLRTRMNLDFAVLLMRSSYNAVDELDIVPMQQFQKDFFLIRQAEYQFYANALGPGAMQQGDLADPNYFDFISFAQYSTICREVNDPAVVFEEQQPVEVGEGQPQQFNTVVIKRDSSLKTNDLAQKHTEIVGNAILDKLIEKFGSTPSAIPKIEAYSRPDASTLLASIKQMVNLFIISGFSFDGSASIAKLGRDANDAAGCEFTIVATSPATLWSGQSLKVRRTTFLAIIILFFSDMIVLFYLFLKAKNAILTNDFLLKTVKALLSRAGYNVAKSSVNYSNNQEITSFTIS
ncbi:hypothetical protein ACHAXN_000469 [Cyclotella atomus]